MNMSNLPFSSERQADQPERQRGDQREPQRQPERLPERRGQVEDAGGGIGQGRGGEWPVAEKRNRTAGKTARILRGATGDGQENGGAAGDGRRD